MEHLFNRSKQIDTTSLVAFKQEINAFIDQCIGFNNRINTFNKTPAEERVVDFMNRIINNFDRTRNLYLKSPGNSDNEESCLSDDSDNKTTDNDLTDYTSALKDRIFTNLTHNSNDIEDTNVAVNNEQFHKMMTQIEDENYSSRANRKLFGLGSDNENFHSHSDNDVESDADAETVLSDISESLLASDITISSFNNDYNDYSADPPFYDDNSNNNSNNNNDNNNKNDSIASDDINDTDYITHNNKRMLKTQIPNPDLIIIDDTVPNVEIDYYDDSKLLI